MKEGYVPDLLNIVNDWIDSNGGRKILADLIISENHDIFTHEAVKADIRLKEKGILTNRDVKPARYVKRHQYNFQAIEQMYYHYTYKQIAAELGKSLSYITHAIYNLVKSGRLVRTKFPFPKWEEEEDLFILQNGHKLQDSELGAVLGRTKFAVRKRRSILRVRKEDQYKKPSGRYSHKIYKQA